jgi:hypothetical protein
MRGFDVAHLALAHLQPDEAIIAVAIAKAESGFDPYAVGDVHLVSEKWGPSIGLWQIRSLKPQYDTGLARDASRLKNPAFNANSMRLIKTWANGWTPWSVYKNGTYKRHLDMATESVRAAMMLTPEVELIQRYLKERWPGAWRHLGIYNRRYIAGTDTPSQHAWGNAIDLGVVSMEQMDEIVEDLREQRQRELLPIGTILWRRENHYDHAHVEGKFRRADSNLPPRLPGEPNEEDMTELVKKIQTALNESGAELQVDGIWGPLTNAAFVKALEGGQHTHEAYVELR